MVNVLMCASARGLVWDPKKDLDPCLLEVCMTLPREGYTAMEKYTPMLHIYVVPENDTSWACDMVSIQNATSALGVIAKFKKSGLMPDCRYDPEKETYFVSPEFVSNIIYGFLECHTDINTVDTKFSIISCEPFIKDWFDSLDLDLSFEYEHIPTESYKDKLFATLESHRAQYYGYVNHDELPTEADITTYKDSTHQPSLSVVLLSSLVSIAGKFGLSFDEIIFGDAGDLETPLEDTEDFDDNEVGELCVDCPFRDMCEDAYIPEEDEAEAVSGEDDDDLDDDLIKSISDILKSKLGTDTEIKVYRVR